MASHCGKRRSAEVEKARQKHLRWCSKVKRKREIWQALRQAQRKSGCTTTTIRTVAVALAPFLEEDETSSEDEPPSQRKVADSEIMVAAEAIKLTLHGCVQCNEFVFGPKELYLRRCPKCLYPRFNERNQPYEVCNYSC